MILLPAMTITNAKLRYSNIVAVSLKLHLLLKSDGGHYFLWMCLLTAENPSVVWPLYSTFKSLTILSPGSLEQEIILSQEKIKLKCCNACWRGEGKGNDRNNRPNNYISCLFVYKRRHSIFMVFNSGLIFFILVASSSIGQSSLKWEATFY